MRKKIHDQLSIVYPLIDHEHATELQHISAILDRIPLAAELVLADLVQDVTDIGNGRPGLTGDQVLRILVLKQMNGFSYHELAFHLADSRCYRAFCSLGIDESSPSKSTLQANIKKIRPETLETINRLVLVVASDDGVELGRQVRVDCTVVEANIHHPSDSSLLWDSVRVLARLLERGRQLAAVPMTNHTRRAKRRALAIRNAKTRKLRTRLYRDLLKVTRKTVRMAEQMAGAVESTSVGLALELRHFAGLAKRIISQTERRVLQCEQVPAAEKVVSLFEDHADVIVKDRRDTYYGHKICLATGKSGLLLDCVIEDGNPADSSLAVDMAQRQERLYGRPPRQMAYDGGFASKDNLKRIKKQDVKDVMFSKKRGLPVLDMVKSTWVYKRLRNWRAGIEGIISFLKRCFGLGRCLWRGERSFQSYVWSSVVSANLLMLARHAME